MTDASKMKIRALSDLPTPPVPTWLARGFVPRCEITVLVGEEGIGKSLYWVLLVARITTGQALPALNLPARDPGDVVLIITEDSTGEVLARLTAAGADLTRIHLFSESDDGSGSPIFPAEMPVLYKWAADKQVTPALIVVDAWLDTVAEGLQVRNTQQGREALKPWKEAATRLQTAVLLVTHTNRMDSANPRDLLGGTVALRQKARMILFAARHPDDGNDGQQHVWIGPEKSNTTGKANAVKFELVIHQARPETDDDPGTVASIANPEDAGATMRTLLQEWRSEQQQADREPDTNDKAETWVRDFMRDREPMPSEDVKEAARVAGFGQRAVKVAMGRCGESKPQAPGQPWVYRLIQSVQPGRITVQTAHTAQTAQTGNEGKQQLPPPDTLVRHIAQTTQIESTERQSVQSMQSVQSVQGCNDVAQTGNRPESVPCRSCGEPLHRLALAAGVCPACPDLVTS